MPCTLLFILCPSLFFELRSVAMEPFGAPQATLLDYDRPCITYESTVHTVYAFTYKSYVGQSGVLVKLYLRTYLFMLLMVPSLVIYLVPPAVPPLVLLLVGMKLPLKSSSVPHHKWRWVLIDL